MVNIFGIFIHLALAIQVFGIQIRVKQGILLGQKLETVTGKHYYSFKRIPYAKPPVGQLRFKAPQDPEPWDEVRDASSHGPVCPQFNLFTGEYMPGSEDCLFINVYTRNLNPKKPLPVIVYIYGGSFLFGSGNMDFYGPDFLVTKDVVLVTFNYRVGALGFLSTDSCEVPGNAGLKDQVAALKWVQDNIGYFGGNASCVTIVGQSAGAASVGYHLLSKKSKGLFHRAIAMSGVPTCDWGFPYQSNRRAFTLGQMLGYESNNTTELINFLQKVPKEIMINKTAYVLAAEKIIDIPLKLQSFTPVIEKKCCKDSFISTNPIRLLEDGAVNTADIMFGYNNMETLIFIHELAEIYLAKYKKYPEMFVPSKIMVNSPPDTVLEIADKIINYYFGEKKVSEDNIAEFIYYMNNATFVYDIQSFFRKWPDVGRKYFYKFSGYSKRNYYGQKGATYGLTGAAHLDDVFHLFDPKRYNFTLETDSVGYQIIELLTTVFTNFAKYGDPTPGSTQEVKWPQYDSDSRAYVDIAQELTVKYAPDEDDYQFWETCYQDAGLFL